MPLKPKKEKKNSFNLKDDCLFTIVSELASNMSYLCSFAEINSRLYHIACRIFNRVYGNSELKYIQIDDLKLAIKHFGSIITDIHVDRCANVTLKLIFRHCSALESLHLNFWTIPTFYSIKLRPIFTKLKKLSLYFYRFDGNSKKLLTHCESLIEMEIYGFINFNNVMENNFPKLEQFALSFINFQYNTEGITSFFSSHNNLKALKIQRCTNVSSVLSTICNNSMLLEEFKLINFGTWNMNFKSTFCTRVISSRFEIFVL